MRLILNIIVLIFEILYYSLFMKYARREGNFLRYIIAFTIVVLIAGFTNVKTFISYAIGLLTILLSLKYIVKLKVSLYDMLFIFIMILSKLLIEFICFIFLGFITNEFIFYILFESIKIIILISIYNIINRLYDKLKIKWNNNNFYIRYIFTILMFIYFISSAFYIIVFYR